MKNSDSNKTLLRNFFSAYGAGDARTMRQLLAPDFVVHGMPPGYAGDTDGFIALAAAFKSAMSDCHNTVEDLIAAEDDKVVARFTTRFVHASEILGVRPSGRRITTTGIEVYRLADGKIAELWGEYNMAELFQSQP